MIIKEIELLDRFCELLAARNYQFKREFRRGSYHNEGYVDIVVLHNRKFIAIEAKVRDFRRVLAQAACNFAYFHLSYILYPKIPSQNFLSNLNHVGLIVPDDNEQFIIFKKSTSFAKVMKPCITKIKRNWLQNRVGRILAPAELPEHYDPQKVNSLKPTYEWGSKSRKLGEGQLFVEDFQNTELDVRGMDHES